MASPARVSSFGMAVDDEPALAPLVVDLAMALEAGDVVTLSGDLGSGKTTFARALIRYLAGDPDLEVPSPTFTLMQVYETRRFPVVHVDLYRLNDVAELAELGMEDVPNGVVLLEWPERAQDMLPADRWDIAFALAPERGAAARALRVTGWGAAAARLERLQATRRFLEEVDYGGALRERLAGDASSRTYERLTLPDHRVILMSSPRRPDGPAVRHGLPYSAVAHLAEDVRPFVAMANGLRSKGFSAPQVYAADLDAGLVLLEDLGSDGVVAGDPPAPVKARYEAAVLVLAALHKQHLPEALAVAPHVEHRLPVYDRDALLIEAELLIDWYLPHQGARVTERMREAYRALWNEALLPALAAPRTWVLRDYHSPNLLWLPERRGVACLGLLDFQDAVLGPAAYDVASLLQDARVDVPASLEGELLGHYLRTRMIDDPRFDVDGFALLYATLAAQRASKILGIFARLDRRDGKPQYLRHLPRVWTYLSRALTHPALAPLRDWYLDNVRPPGAATLPNT